MNHASVFCCSRYFFLQLTDSYGALVPWCLVLWLQQVTCLYYDPQTQQVSTTRPPATLVWNFGQLLVLLLAGSEQMLGMSSCLGSHTGYIGFLAASTVSISMHRCIPAGSTS